MVFHPTIPSRLVSGFQQFNDLKRNSENAWVGSIRDIGSHLEVLGPSQVS